MNDDSNLLLVAAFLVLTLCAVVAHQCNIYDECAQMSDKVERCLCEADTSLHTYTRSYKNTECLRLMRQVSRP